MEADFLPLGEDAFLFNPNEPISHLEISPVSFKSNPLLALAAATLAPTLRAVTGEVRSAAVEAVLGWNLRGAFLCLAKGLLVVISSCESSYFPLSFASPEFCFRLSFATPDSMFAYL